VTPPARVATVRPVGEAEPVRPGTTIALGVLLFLIFAAAILQFVILGRG
jgi:hypothetical protein